MHTYTHTYMCVYIYIYIHMCLFYMCIYVCICVYMYVYMYIHIYIYSPSVVLPRAIVLIKAFASRARRVPRFACSRPPRSVFGSNPTLSCRVGITGVYL